MALAVGLAGCSGGGSTPVALDACGKKVTIDSPTRLTYLGAADVVEDVAALCERVETAKIEAKVLGAGRDRIVIEVQGKDVVAAKAIARTGQLAFYDWEANVIGPSGKLAPTDPSVTGGPGAGVDGSIPFYEAVVRASKRPANVQTTNARKGSLFYAVDPQAKRVLGSGAATRAAALDAVPAAQRPGAKVLEVKPGTVVLRGEQARDDDPNGRWYFVLRDDVALRGGDLRNPEQNFAEGPGGNGEPIVTFEFASAGAKAFQGLTRTLADRGSRSVGVASGQTAPDANQHFAIVLDDQIVSVPYIDFRQNPEGIDGRDGSQIQGGFTIASARQLASVLNSGALPVPLELVATTKP